MGGLSKQRFPTPEEEEEEEGRFHDPIHHPTASSSSLFLSRPTSNPLRVFARRRESHGARSPPLLILGNWIQPSPPPCACACVFVERPWNRVIGPPRYYVSHPRPSRRHYVNLDCIYRILKQTHEERLLLGQTDVPLGTEELETRVSVSGSASPSPSSRISTLSRSLIRLCSL